VSANESVEQAQEKQAVIAEAKSPWLAFDGLDINAVERCCNHLEATGYSVHGIFPEPNNLELTARYTVMGRKVKKPSILPALSSAIVVFLAIVGALDFVGFLWHLIKVALPRLVFFSIFVAACFGQDLVDAPRPSIIPQRTAHFSEKVFWSSIAMQQMATAFDGWTTMRMQKMGHHEASFPEGWQEIYGRHPSLLKYAAISEGLDAAEAIAGRAMMHSRRRWVRVAGFVLLNEQTAEHLDGGFHNLGLRPVRGDR